MECINATRLRRKSGQRGHPALVAGVAKTMVRLRPLDLILIPRALAQGLKPSWVAGRCGTVEAVPFVRTFMLLEGSKDYRRSFENHFEEGMGVGKENCRSLGCATN